MKYAATAQGAQSLRKLGHDLNLALVAIQDASRDLQTEIFADQGSLGALAGEIVTVAQSIAASSQNAAQDCAVISARANKLADNIDAYLGGHQG